MKKTLVLLIALLASQLSWGALPFSFQPNSAARISGNSIIDIVYNGVYLWVGTNNGISRTSDGGRNWDIINSADGLNREEISALGFLPGVFLVGEAHTELFTDFEVQVGDGFNLTTDGGNTWPSSRPFQASSPLMLAFDIAGVDTFFYASCFAGGLIRSLDRGANWANVYVDSFARNDLEDSVFADLRNRYFAVVADSSKKPDTTIIWAGSAAGIQRFVYTDSLEFDQVTFFQHLDSTTCIFQKNYYCDSADVAIGFHVETESFFCGPGTVVKVDSIPCPTQDTVIDRDTITVLPAISGNFVVALGVQYTAATPVIWAACRPTFTGEIAVNYSKDEGKTWDTTLTGEFVWNFAFQDTMIWAATSAGLKRSLDWGATWENFTNMRDSSAVCVCEIFSPEFFAVAAVGDTIWAGGADGLVRTTDNGFTWKVYRAFEPIGSSGSPSAYAFPSPFSPRLGSGIGVTRIHHRPAQTGKVTVEIYDFAMNRVITLVDGENRTAGQECDEPWTGKDQDGKEVATGVYFFKVKGSGETQWGKIVVLK